MNNQSDIIFLQQSIERRTIRYRKMASHMAQLNATPDNYEHISEVIHKSLAKTWHALADAKIELEKILNTPGNLLYSNKLVDCQDNGTVLLVDDANRELIKFLSMHPSYLHKLHSRVFEELIARIFSDLGYSVELMPATHDGGKDIILTYNSPMGRSIAYVQCKRYSPENKVGIKTVRELYGVHDSNRINKSLIVTTSDYTKDAYNYAQGLSFLISLKNFVDIENWLKQYK